MSDVISMLSSACFWVAEAVVIGAAIARNGKRCRSVEMVRAILEMVKTLKRRLLVHLDLYDGSGCSIESGDGANDQMCLLAE